MASLVASDAYGDFLLEGDSFYLQNGELIVAAIRSRDKYSSMLQTLDYWLCVGHSFIQIDSKRDKVLTESILHYPFRIPWAKVEWVKPTKLYYDPMSWDSRIYKSRKIEYKNISEIQLSEWIKKNLKSAEKTAKRLNGLSIKQAVNQIEKNNGEVWVGKEYLKSYRSEISTSLP